MGARTRVPGVANHPPTAAMKPIEAKRSPSGVRKAIDPVSGVLVDRVHAVCATSPDLVTCQFDQHQGPAANGEPCFAAYLPRSRTCDAMPFLKLSRRQFAKMMG